MLLVHHLNTAQAGVRDHTEHRLSGLDTESVNPEHQVRRVSFVRGLRNLNYNFCQTEPVKDRKVCFFVEFIRTTKRTLWLFSTLCLPEVYFCVVWRRAGVVEPRNLQTSRPILKLLVWMIRRGVIVVCVWKVARIRTITLVQTEQRHFSSSLVLPAVTLTWTTQSRNSVEFCRLWFPLDDRIHPDGSLHLSQLIHWRFVLHVFFILKHQQFHCELGGQNRSKRWKLGNLTKKILNVRLFFKDEMISKARDDHQAFNENWFCVSDTDNWRLVRNEQVTEYL